MPPRLRVGPLLPKLRGQLAEFLHEGSLARLSLLSSPTCVGLRYGPPTAPAGLFWAPAATLDAPYGALHQQERVRSQSVPRRSTRPAGHGISTVCPSPTPLGLGLGPTNLGRTNLAQETLGFRRGRFSLPFSLLIPASSLVRRPVVLPVHLHPDGQRSPTQSHRSRLCHSFGDNL